MIAWSLRRPQNVGKSPRCMLHPMLLAVVLAFVVKMVDQQVAENREHAGGRRGGGAWRAIGGLRGRGDSVASVRTDGQSRGLWGLSPGSGDGKAARRGCRIFLGVVHRIFILSPIRGVPFYSRPIQQLSDYEAIFLHPAAVDLHRRLCAAIRGRARGYDAGAAHHRFRGTPAGEFRGSAHATGRKSEGAWFLQYVNGHLA